MKNDENSPGPAIAIEKWVNGFELIVCYSHPYERIHFGRRVIGEFLQVSEFPPNQIFAFWGRVNDFLCVRILNFGSGQIANSGVVLFDDIDDLDCQVSGEEGALFESIHSMPECFPVME